MTQHAGLDAARWSNFQVDQQILMIGNEMNRVQRSLSRDELDPARRGYERVLRLTDLTIGALPRPSAARAAPLA